MKIKEYLSGFTFKNRLSEKDLKVAICIKGWDGILEGFAAKYPKFRFQLVFEDTCALKHPQCESWFLGGWKSASNSSKSRNN